jgi:alpha-amylase
MRRRPEAYHEALRALEAEGSADTKDMAANPHEDVSAKEAGLARALVYDDHERRSGLVRVLDRDGRQVGDFVNGPWQIDEVSFSELTTSRTGDALAVRKSFSIAGGKLDARVSIGLHVSALDAFAGSVELEMNLNLSGGGANPDAYYRWTGHEERFDSNGNVLPGVTLSLGNQHEGVDIEARAEPGAEASWASIETVSNSEAGFERVHQGSCLLFSWPVALAAGETREFEVGFVVTQTRDRAADEAAAQ